MSNLVRSERDARGVATLWLARADKHNALNPEMLGALEEAAAALGANPDVRVVVLAAEGPTFCAGGDLAWFRSQAEMDGATRTVESRRIATALKALADLPQPLIGRVQGNAFGGGVGLACVCDVTIGADGVKMGLTETRLGVIPANIGPYVIARMGGNRAREVFMSSRVFGAEEAVRLGILNRVVAGDALDAAIEAEVVPYLSCAPGAVRDAKALLRALSGTVTEAQVDSAIDALAARWDSAEAAEGLAAFFEKRQPSWTVEG
ncbi:crotonase/enoyl-CoA hydratase family protein [Mesobacterium sp. TK19101]|uniref:Crotonase/enoyl-CoA hydratase family protein n=1 Tax=Mesobacterium hydrothermale TaxID=3111907 RepID=A0ABU6HCA8_9RHOB|nr:crotonase/enoyl-CoA hydratase family protein [Mesobacterium sp. TK19101]MEC3860026.1 crotonase/enoyl-CoA hydratase family protein [Mesobacterium sp. TK19101]